MTEQPQPRVLTPKQQRSVELMAEVKFAIRMMLQKYATEAFEISNGQQDASLPVVAVIQMGLAQAATEYLITAGHGQSEAVQLMTSYTERAMHTWLQTLFKQHSQTTAPPPATKKQRRKRNGRSVQGTGH